MMNEWEIREDNRSQDVDDLIFDQDSWEQISQR